MAATGPDDETSLGTAAAAQTRRASSPSPSGWLSSSQPGESGFAPGTILADRYRIIGLVGRGGMGEVYRADDLRLGQPVALKFLPDAVAGDPLRLAQFHNEVRTARQVSHRNVCRVYDIGEADGRVFLTMEYVDGEEVGALLKRIGRFPADRAVEVARQLCAGLAAAHEQGVLHRDLKPSNVMLDREGRVRITDFGLAGVAGEIHDIRAGTPAYMAPEQLAGREVSIRSDLFALGLVLFEIFTGRRAFEARTLHELLEMHDRGLALTPTSAVRDLDPAVERAILRCLERDPARRPASAIAVSAALPGGDPLAAALAAGETPSPEMVANAGAREAIPAAYGLAALALVIVGIVLATWVASRFQAVHRIPFDKPPAVLADRARTILESLGYRERPVGVASGFSYSREYERWIDETRRGPDRWRDLMSGRAPTVRLWYRTSPGPLGPDGLDNRVRIESPPLTQSGMTLVVVDTLGRLLQFQAVPPRHEPVRESPAAPDWRLLFDAAALPMDRFTPATPEWTPPDYADRRMAWTGILSELGNMPVRIEAAAYRDRITSFVMVYPWTAPAPTASAVRSMTERITADVATSLYLAVLLIALLVARRNVLSGRGDWRGAIRIGVAAGLFSLVSWILIEPIPPNINAANLRYSFACAWALYLGASLWVFYLALEPTVRRVWPDGLISWNRLLAGNWRDPLVGWHVLVGVACAFGLYLVMALERIAPLMLGDGAAAPSENAVWFLERAGLFVGGMVDSLFDGMNAALFLVFCYALARRYLRREILVALLVVTVFSLAIAEGFLRGDQPLLESVQLLLTGAVLYGVLRLFGLLALTVALIGNELLQRAPFTFDLSAWYAYAAILILLVVVGLAVAGFVISRAGAPLFGRALLGEADA